MGEVMSEAAVQLPRYKCHKEVWAAKIMAVDVKRGVEGFRLGARLSLDFGDGRESAYAEVDGKWLSKHSPEVGGYYVQYDDGYRSYSPAAAFESGYTLIRNGGA
jgi:hypothetical protein